MSQRADPPACCLMPRVVLELLLSLGVWRLPWSGLSVACSSGHPHHWGTELPPVGQLFSRWGPSLILLLNLRTALVKVTSGPRLGRMPYPSRWLMLCCPSYGQIPLSSPSTPASWGLWCLLPHIYPQADLALGRPYMQVSFSVGSLPMHLGFL